MEGLRSFLTPASVRKPLVTGGGGLGGDVCGLSPDVLLPHFASAGTGGGGKPCNIVVPTMGGVIEQHSSSGGE
jgi:hypothetical protein